MDEARVTRRTALAGAAGAGAAHLLPAVAVARVLRRGPGTSSLTVGTVAGESRPLRAPGRFQLVGVQWSGPKRPVVELRTRLHNGGWSVWSNASSGGHGPDDPVQPSARFGDPIWSGDADWIQLRVPVPLHGVRIHFVSVPDGHGRAGVAQAYPLAQPVLDAGPGQPRIIARGAWSHGAPPSVPPGYGTVKLAFVHHTENPNGYRPDQVPAMLLAIYRFHRFVRGWHDIGYNFVVDLYGRIWEARQGGAARPVVGAQAGGYNQVSTGVAVLGSFMAVPPSAAAIDALEHLLAWKLALHGVPALGRVTVRVNPSDAFYTPFRPGQRVSLPRVAGHRDGDSTNCPGNAFYARLPSIRPRVAQLEGTPLRLTAAASSSAAVAPATVGLSGRLRTLDGAPVPAAQVLLQTLRGATISTVRTGSDGTWSASTQLIHNSRFQAVSASAVSDVVTIGVRPSINVSVQSLSPLLITGEVSPAKRRVVVELYALRGGRRRLVIRRGVRAAAGRFNAEIRTRQRGPHEVVVRTAADARNAAGASAPVSVEL